MLLVWRLSSFSIFVKIDPVCTRVKFFLIGSFFLSLFFRVNLFVLIIPCLQEVLLIQKFQEEINYVRQRNSIFLRYLIYPFPMFRFIQHIFYYPYYKVKFLYQFYFDVLNMQLIQWAVLLLTTLYSISSYLILSIIVGGLQHNVWLSVASLLTWNVAKHQECRL